MTTTLPLHDGSVRGSIHDGPSPDRPPQEQPPQDRHRSRRRLLLTGALVLAVLAAGTAGWAIAASRPSRTAPTHAAAKTPAEAATPAVTTPKAAAPDSATPAATPPKASTTPTTSSGSAPATQAPSTPSAPAAPTTPTFAGVPTAAVVAITSWETANGPGAGTWQITSAQTSSVNPAYVLFHIGPAAGYENTVQGGYGFALDQGGQWSVVGFGSADVGCPGPGVHAPTVPTAVLSGFGLGCPTP